jgi:hypothetical protein
MSLDQNSIIEILDEYLALFDFSTNDGCGFYFVF